ncbi:bifunctional folylpolyglutamate synthase/dihydrofolate synthase [bacterium]|nr:bifunctional folylpolyglutamate synthase/dihydrofolate synthase [bacterium]
MDEKLNKRITNIEEAVSFVYSFINYEKKTNFTYNTKSFDILKFEELLNGLGSPHQQYKTIHVVGTKGKGSTCAILSSLLTRAGFKTGSYTSPHLEKINERICIDGKPIEDDKFTSIVEILRNYIHSSNLEFSTNFRTTFELLTASAFIYFAQEKVDFAVIEAGLGGRLDTTNVINPEIVLITSISLDHTNILGDSLEKIAYEKGGVIKKNILVYSNNQTEIVQNILKDISNKRETDIHFLNTDCYIKNLVIEKKGISFDYEDADYILKKLFLPLTGDFQGENALMAIKAFRYLHGNGDSKVSSSIRNGLLAVKWRGRIEILSTNPYVIADAAHNPDSMGKMLKNIKSIFEFKKILCVLSISTNKDIPELCKILSSHCNMFYVTCAEPSRSASHDLIQKHLSEYQNVIHIEELPQKALSRALEDADKEDLVLITGSVYLVGCLLSYFDNVETK